jgi:hypothetical protein
MHCSGNKNLPCFEHFHFGARHRFSSTAYRE